MALDAHVYVRGVPNNFDFTGFQTLIFVCFSYFPSVYSHMQMALLNRGLKATDEKTMMQKDVAMYDFELCSNRGTLVSSVPYRIIFCIL